MEITYRILNAGDLTAYRQVRLECLKMYPDNFGSTYEEEAASETLFLDKILAKNQAHDFFLGAFSEKELIGICGFKQEGRLKTDHRGEIVQMYLKPSFSGKGIGTKLLITTLQKAFENSLIDQVTLGVVALNESAVSLYINIGFVQYARLENSFKENGKGWAQLLMVLTRERFSEIEKS
jgi:RimJ/RimL family protein N-acetyltransferase